MPPDGDVAAPRGDEPRAQPRPRFGVVLSGVHVLLPAGVITEFVAQAPVYPVPRAPQRLLGLMQLRGQPVPVFDAAEQPDAELPRLRRRDVLLIGTGAEAGAVAVEAPPRPLSPVPGGERLPGPAVCFDAALGEGYVDPAEPDLTWWLLDPRPFFEILAQPAEKR